MEGMLSQPSSAKATVRNVDLVINKHLERMKTAYKDHFRVAKQRTSTSGGFLIQ